MIKALIWDVGGVLIEDPKYNEFWKGVSGSEDIRIRFGTRKITTKEFIKEGSTLMDITQTAFLEKYKEAYWTGERNEEAIRMFKHSGLKNYVFSDTNPIHLQYLKRIGKDIFNNAEKVFTDIRKKYPSSYKEIMKLVGLKPEEIVFIDNKAEYVKLSKENGMKGILYRDNLQLKKELSKNGLSF